MKTFKNIVAPLIISLMALVSGISATAFAEGKLPGASLYLSNLSMRDDSGARVGLDQWKGSPVVISMAYTSCAHTCPLTIQKLHRIEERFAAKSKKAHFVVVTFDPTRDTPERLAEYRKKTGVTESNWHFLTASEADTRRVAMLLGIKFRKNAQSGDIMHDNRVLVLDGDGVVRHAFDGLSADVSQAAD